ncbi:Delta-sarcoglycan [Sarcoptes scabiei]|nr:Delta-sarcoglycan [Sarcoptes scabiei]
MPQIIIKTNRKVSIETNELLTFGGTKEPCALIECRSIGSISLEENRIASKRLFEILESDLNLSPGRVFIDFFDMSADDVAWNQQIFSDRFRSKTFSK